MFCPACGSELARPTRFCIRCGARLQLSEKTEVTPLEKRFDEYLDGLFWTAFFGLSFMIGGAAIFSEILDLSRGFIIGYLILCSLAFLIIFGLSLWQTLLMARAIYKPADQTLTASRDTDRTLPSASATPAEAVSSVTEATTRNFDPVPADSRERG